MAAAGGALFRDDDVGLLQAYRRGDVRGFERLFARHHDRLRALAVRYLRDPVEADDVLQETFLRLLRIADTVDDGFNVMAWLHRVAANICLTQLRTARRVQLVDSDSEPMRAEEDGRRTGQPEAAYEMTLAREIFGRVVRRLPEQQRICLVLREVEGLSYRDIADRLSVSAGSVEIWARPITRNVSPTPGTRNRSDTRGSRTMLRRLSTRLVPRRVPPPRGRGAEPLRDDPPPPRGDRALAPRSPERAGRRPAPQRVPRLPAPLGLARRAAPAAGRGILVADGANLPIEGFTS